MRMWYVLSAWLYHCAFESECVYAAGCLCPCPCVSLNVKVFQEVCIPVFVHGRNVGFSCMCTHVYAVVYSLWCVPYFLNKTPSNRQQPRIYAIARKATTKINTAHWGR